MDNSTNSTQIVSFILAAYGNLGHLKYLYFTIIFLSYITIVVANTGLIVVIYVERTLHEPMYVFLCSLFVNELYGSTAIFTCLLSQMLSDTHEVPFIYCFLQLFCLYTYAIAEYSNLAVMAYDRYVSICYPLQYHVIMTSGRVCVLLLLVWAYSVILFTVPYSLTVRLRFCGNLINKVYCDIHVIHTLSCSVSTANNVYILVVAVASVIVPLIPLSFSYIKVFTVCLKTSKETKQKAVSTCMPHIVAVTNFAMGCFFEMCQSLFDMNHLSGTMRVILSAYLVVCQPLLSPIVYGLNLSKIRDVGKSFLQNKK
ncbi:olfactory receptor 8U3-like [Centroberyx affinis]|uniref:olfactory receptor 8U3-like n=1 Tax=Centroberyx affinis TaxID=166261 RepID=UPI003A5BAD77